MSGVGACNGEQGYSTPEELWSRKASGEKREEWYNKSVDFWDHQEASVNGVLGGFGHVSNVDVADSKALLNKVFKAQLQEAAGGSRRLVAVDCGAGVGRVSEQLLLHFFHEVDLVEPSKHLIETAKAVLAKGAGSKYPKQHAAVDFICKGLQDFQPSRRYDCIWVQWCLLYLTDDDTIQFFQRSKDALTDDGIVVVKENVCGEGFVVDDDDNGITRSHAYMLDLFKKSGMKVIYSTKQKKFPKGLFPVWMYVLRPEATDS